MATVNIGSQVSNTAPLDVDAGPADAGTDGDAARVDHKHDIATASPSTASGGTNAEGSSNSMARADHKHRVEVKVQDGGSSVGDRPTINFIGASSVVDNGGSDRVDVTLTGTTQTLTIPVRNESGSLIAAGKLVASVGYSGAEGRTLVDLADKDDSGKRPAIGFTTSSIANNANGDILVEGIATGINTSSFAINDQLVLGNTGDFSRPPPDQDPFTGEVQSVGSVSRVDASSGEVVLAFGGLDVLTADEHFGVTPSLNRGVISGGAVTRGAGLNIDVASGEGFVTSSGLYKRVVWGAQSFAMPASVSRFIYIDNTGTLQSAVSSPDLDQNLLLANAVSDGSSTVLLSTHSVEATKRNASEHKYAEEVIGPVAVSGGTATINGGDALRLDVDLATFYILDVRKTVAATAPITFTYWYRDGVGGWTKVPSTTQIDPNNFDDGSGTLAAIPSTEWKKDLLFIVANDSGVEYHVVYGQETFTTQGLAEIGNIPIPIDDLRIFALRSSGVVIQDGAASITSITDERPFVGQLSTMATSTTDHGNLSGLSDDDHTQYLLANGSRAMSGSLDMGTNAITNVGNVDGVDVSAHASRHNPGGADSLATATPVAITDSTNAEGSATSFARSDHQHSHGSRGGGTLHALAIASGAAGFMSGADKSKLDGIPSGGSLRQSVFKEITVDTTNTSATYITLLSQAVTITAGGILLVNFTCSFSNTVDATLHNFRLSIDGGVKRATATSVDKTPRNRSASIVYRQAGLAAGSRTVLIEWQVSGGTGRIRPVAAPDDEHASLLITEVGA